MKFLPFSFIPLDKLKRGARRLRGIGSKAERFFPSLSLELAQAEIDIGVKEYLSLCMLASSAFFVFLSAVIGVILVIANVRFGAEANVVSTSLLVSMFVTFFVFLQQIHYPRLLKSRRARSLDNNLLYALRTIMVQVDSGVPLFDVFVSIANGHYGEVSRAFAKAVKEISAGRSQADALQDLTTNNPSLFFRRAMWQLSNGMKAGSDISRVLAEVIKSVATEQMNQIIAYGSQLNPVAMFYMLLTVIVPSLSVTFLIVISSFLAFSDTTTKLMFSLLLAGVLFIQMIFLGATKSKQPTLQGE